MMLNGWLKYTTDMETKFKFKAQVCTSIEQSRRLLELGLKKEIADMHWFYTGKIHGWQHCSSETYIEAISHPFKKEWATNGVILPAWSLGRLIEMIKKSDYLHYDDMGCIKLYLEQDDFDRVIAIISIMVKEGYFNKEYLENGN